MSLDLVLRGGRVIDPSQAIDSVMDVGFRDGRVAELRAGLDGKSVRDVTGLIVTPGLIDLAHACLLGRHLARRRSAAFSRAGGCTTLVDTGSAGPGNYPGFLEHVIRAVAGPHHRLLNVSFAGIYGFSKRVMVGESGDLRLMAPIDAVEVARANRDTIVGIKVRVGFHASQNSGIVPLDIALKVAEETGLPMMAHIDVSAADARGSARAAPARRHSHPLLPPVPQQPGDRRRRRAPGRDRGAQARGHLRHRPWHGIFRVQDRADDARQRLCARLHIERRSCALHRWAGFRSPHDDVEVSLPRHAARRHGAGRDGRAGEGSAPQRSRNA